MGIPGADTALRGVALVMFVLVAAIALRGVALVVPGCIFSPPVESSEMALWKSVVLVMLPPPCSAGLPLTVCCVLAAWVLVGVLWICGVVVVAAGVL